MNTDEGKTEKAVADPWAAAKACLRKLPPSGPGSFEEFSADALSEITGHGFNLMKSGGQGGADALSDAWTGFVVAMEAKRYADTTTLPLDALRAKVIDLAHEHPAADLWVLAATRPISAGDEKALRKTGDGMGIDVLVLDTRRGVGGLPPLLVLCAAAPASVGRHWPAPSTLAATLDDLRADPGFEAALTALKLRLASADVGYASCQQAMAEWLRQAMSDLKTAKAHLGSHADLLSDANRTLGGREALAARSMTCMPGTANCTRSSAGRAWGKAGPPSTGGTRGLVPTRVGSL